MCRGYDAAQLAYDRQEPPEDKPVFDRYEAEDRLYEQRAEERTYEMR